MAGQHPHYHKWLRYYLDFCHNYSFSPTDRLTLPAFQEKLRAKHQSESLCQQAEHAVSLYWEMVSSTATEPCLAADAATQQGVETRNAALATSGERLPVSLRWGNPRQNHPCRRPQRPNPSCDRKKQLRSPPTRPWRRNRHPDRKRQRLVGCRTRPRTPSGRFPKTTKRIRLDSN